MGEGFFTVMPIFEANFPAADASSADDDCYDEEERDADYFDPLRYVSKAFV